MVVEAFPEIDRDDQARARQPNDHTKGDSLPPTHQTVGDRKTPRFAASSSTQSWVSSPAGWRCATDSGTCRFGGPRPQTSSLRRQIQIAHASLIQSFDDHATGFMRLHSGPGSNAPLVEHRDSLVG